MELCSRLLGQSKVGRVLDQQVPEPERVLPCKLRLFRRDELLLHQETERRGNLAAQVARHQRRDGSAVKDLPLDRTALEHCSLEIGQAVEPASSKAVNEPGIVTSSLSPAAVASVIRWSTRCAMTCSRNSGLPWAASKMRRVRSGAKSPPAISCSARVWESRSPKGSST